MKDSWCFESSDVKFQRPRKSRSTLSEQPVSKRSASRTIALVSIMGSMRLFLNVPRLPVNKHLGLVKGKDVVTAMFGKHRNRLLFFAHDKQRVLEFDD